MIYMIYTISLPILPIVSLCGTLRIRLYLIHWENEKKSAVRIVHGADKYNHTHPMFQGLQIVIIEEL